MEKAAKLIKDASATAVHPLARGVPVSTPNDGSRPVTSVGTKHGTRQAAPKAEPTRGVESGHLLDFRTQPLTPQHQNCRNLSTNGGEEP